jgi:hypothetical protein
MTPMTCPFCAAPGLLKLDRKSRPYWSCRGCAVRLFLHSDQSFLGFSLLAGMVASIGKDRWMGEISRARASLQLPGTLVAEAQERPAAPEGQDKVQPAAQDVSDEKVR